MEEYRRKHFFTNIKYQIKYTSVIVFFMLLISFVIGAMIYWDLSHTFVGNTILEPVRLDKYIIRIGFVLLIALLSGIFLSHKIIGPLRRLEKMVADINAGKFDVRINLRIGDDFRELAQQLNILAENMKSISDDNPGIKELLGSKDLNDQ
ncbi:HAMP domain-containing protein [Elusimicrobiota bacterium]